MATFLVTFAVFTLAAAGLGVGYLLANKELKGSCGGLSAMSGEPCPVCGGEPSKCESADSGVQKYVPEAGGSER